MNGNLRITVVALLVAFALLFIGLSIPNPVAAQTQPLSDGMEALTTITNSVTSGITSVSAASSCIGGFSASQINSYLSCYGSPLRAYPKNAPAAVLGGGDAAGSQLFG
jgi:hypothetical protein